MLKSAAFIASLVILAPGAFARETAPPAESCEAALVRLRQEQAVPFKDIAALLPRARFLDAKAAFLAERRDRLPALVDPRHAPALLDHGRPTDTVVVVLHGLYDSPHAQRNLAKGLFAKGMNVVMPLLPNHWEKDSARMDKVRYQDFIAETERTIALAKKMGKKVVIYGHSAGGLLAVNAALQDPSIAGLVLAAPALELTTPFSLITTVGATFGANANTFTGEKPDAYFTPYYSSHAGDEVRRMSEALRNKWGWSPLYNLDPKSAREVKTNMYRNIKMPVMMLSAEGDPVADNDDMSLLMASAGGAKRHFHSMKLDHSQIGVLPENAVGTKPGSPSKDPAKDLAHREVWEGISGFFDENFKPPRVSGRRP